jgi:hypothetical protein
MIRGGLLSPSLSRKQRRLPGSYEESLFYPDAGIESMGARGSLGRANLVQWTLNRRISKSWQAGYITGI